MKDYTISISYLTNEGVKKNVISLIVVINFETTFTVTALVITFLIVSEVFKIIQLKSLLWFAAF